MSTDEELAQLNVPELLRAGLAAQEGTERRTLFGDGAVAAAVQLDRVGVYPRSVVYLAEIARSGGVRYAANLTEPLPTPEQTEVIRPWLDAAAEVSTGIAHDEALEDWLKATATLLAARRSVRGEDGPLFEN